MLPATLTRVRSLSLTSWMLIAMVAGVAFGLASPEAAKQTEIVSNIFLRLIKSVIAPVLFGALVSSIAKSPSLRELGRIGWKAALYFEVATSIALLIGWGVVTLFQPGVGVVIQHSGATLAKTPSFSQVVEAAFPSSIFDAMARGDVLQIVVFCILFGIACHAVGTKALHVAEFAEAISQIAYRYTKYVMYLAPFAVCAAIASTVAQSGWQSLKGLALFILAAWVGQVAYLLLVQGGSLLASGVPFKRFAEYAREPFLIAFATTSSAAALPQTLEKMEAMGVPRRIVAIVTPLSLTFNMSGSCIHLAMCAFFVLQAEAAQIKPTLLTALMILATLKLTSKGVAGIPRANFVILTGLFASFGLPPEGLTLLLGIDAAIDPIRTSVNVLGHCVASPLLARWEGVVVQLVQPVQPVEPGTEVLPVTDIRPVK